MNKIGFTLLQMLIAILIISILAAVSFTKYKFAVEKTKITKTYEKMASISKSMQNYILANGEQSLDSQKTFEVLDIEYRKSGPYNFFISESGYDIYPEIDKNMGGWYIKADGKHLAFFFTGEGDKMCFPKWDENIDDLGLNLCKYMSSNFGFDAVESKPIVKAEGTLPGPYSTQP